MGFIKISKTANIPIVTGTAINKKILIIAASK